MKQVVLLDHSKGSAFLQDVINRWIIKADDNGWKILDIFIPSGGMVAIVYEVTDLEEIENIRNKLK